MKEVFHKVFAFTMAILLFASTLSWTVGKHYCMGRLMNVSLFEHAEDCGMDMGEMSETAFSDENKSCCNDELVVIEGQDDLKLSFEVISIDKQQFLAAYSLSYIYLLEGFVEQPVSQYHYTPPLLVKDIQLLDEVYLI